MDRTKNDARGDLKENNPSLIRECLEPAEYRRWVICHSRSLRLLY